MIKNPAAVALGLAMALAACSGAGPPTATGPSSPTQTVNTASRGTTPKPSTPEGPPTPGGEAALVSAATRPAPPRSSPSSRALSSNPAPSGPAAAALTSFDTWLTARTHDDSTTMLSSSTGAAAAFGTVEIVGDKVVTSRGAQTQTQIVKEQLTPTHLAPTSVIFGGEVDVRETVTSGSKTATVEHQLTGPIRVVQQGGVWKVQSATYDGVGMVYYPQGLHQAIGGNALSVDFVLSYAKRTVVIAELRSASPHVNVHIVKLVLTGASGTQQSGTAYSVKGESTLLLDFARSADAPAHLDLSTRDLTGTEDDFSLALQRTAG